MAENQEDLKDTISMVPDNGQSGSDPKEAEEDNSENSSQAEAEVEDISTLPPWAQNRIKKEQEEKENYKKGLLSVKKKSLTPEKTEEPKKESEEEYPDWDEASKKFQKQTISQAETIAEKKAREIVENYNEKAGISRFIAEHPEVGADDKWSELIANYSPKHGRESAEGVYVDLQRAFVLTQYEQGNLTEVAAVKKGEKKGEANVKLAEANTVSKTTLKSGSGEGSTLSPGAIKMATKMRVDMKKLAQEDDSRTAVIHF